MTHNQTRHFWLSYFAFAIWLLLIFLVASGGLSRADAAGLGDPVADEHIAQQIAAERAARWALTGSLVAGVSASESDLTFGDDLISFDSIGGDDYLGGVRLGIEHRRGLFTFGVHGEVGGFAESENAFAISGTQLSEFSADYYWLVTGMVGVELIDAVMPYVKAGYGEIETGNISLLGTPAGDPDLGGLVFGGGIQIEFAHRLKFFAEAVKWHDVEGDVPEVKLDSDIWQIKGGITVDLF